MGAVIGALTGSDDKDEVAVMAKQATEVRINLIKKTDWKSHFCKGDQPGGDPCGSSDNFYESEKLLLSRKNRERKK